MSIFTTFTHLSHYLALFRSIRSREQIPDELRPYLEQEHLWLRSGPRRDASAPQPTSAENDSSRRVTKSWPAAPAGATSSQ